MKVLRDSLYFIGAFLLFISIVMIVWYILFYSQKPDIEEKGTLAFMEQTNPVLYEERETELMGLWDEVTKERQEIS